MSVFMFYSNFSRYSIYCRVLADRDLEAVMTQLHKNLVFMHYVGFVAVKTDIDEGRRSIIILAEP